MAKAAASGHEVFVALLTSGDGFKEDAARYYLSLDVSKEEYLHMGYERQIETQAALARVGVPKEHIAFLGYPDGGLDALWLTHWNQDPWTSPTTGYDATPYLTALRPNSPYRGIDLLSLLMGLYEEIQPTQLVMPSAFDTHPDHWGTNAYATLAWAEWAHRDAAWRTMPRWGYLVHWPAWPLPLAYRPEMEAEAPERLVALGQEPWHKESLQPGWIDAKREALLAYESQVELIKLYMLAFCRKTELFSVESGWQGDVREGLLAVSNPASDWVSRTLRRTNPLARISWGRRSDRDVAVVELSRTLDAEERIEISLHPVDGEHRHYRWLAGRNAVPDAVQVVARGTRWEFSWPTSWIGGAPLVVAGVQVYNRDKSAGKIPFRVIPWRDNQ